MGYWLYLIRKVSRKCLSTNIFFPRCPRSYSPITIFVENKTVNELALS